MRRLFFFPMPRMPESVQRVMRLLASGSRQEAEAFTERCLIDTREHRRTKKTGLMLAESDLARIYTLLGRLEEAISAMERAVAVPIYGDAAKEEVKLKCRTNLAELLFHAGRGEESRRAHEECLQQRRSFYGGGSLGYALGLAPFAEMLLGEGQAQEAELKAKEALSILLEVKAPQAARVAALYASIRAALYRDDRPLIETFHSFEMARSQLIEACLERTQRDPPGLSLLVLDELRERLEDSQSEQLNTVVTIQQRAAEAAGEHARSAEFLTQQLRNIQGTEEQLGLLLSLASARGLSGDEAGEHTAFEEAEQRALEIGVGARVRVLRNRGRALSRRGRMEEARGAFDAALALAEGGVLRGEALFAKARFLFHNAPGDEATRLFEEAIALLPPQNSASRFAVEHVSAAARQVGCSCAVEEETLRQARRILPLGLLRGLWVRAGTLGADFSSSPTSREHAQLTRCFREVSRELGGILGAQGS